MKQPLLSIFCPTHHAKALHYSSLMNLISIAEKFDEIELVISDNSNDIDKRKFLLKYAKSNIKIIEGPFHNNYFYALAQTTGKYVLPSGDDDLVVSAGVGAVLTKIRENHAKNVYPTGYSGILGIAGTISIKLITLSEMSSDTLTDRLKLSPANSKLITFVRRDIALNAWDFWSNQIPNPLSCYDLLASAYMALSGRFTFVPQLYFILDEGNNRGTNEAVVETETNHAMNIKTGDTQNVPTSYVLLLFLDLAICGYFLIGSKRFDIEGAERLNGRNAWFMNCFQTWRNYFLSIGFEKKETVHTCPYFSDVMLLVEKYKNCNEFKPFEVLQDLAAIREKFNASGNHYYNFWINV